MRLLDFTTVAPREVAPGYLGRYVHSDHITQGRVDIAPGAVIPDHSHPHEQLGIGLSGVINMIIEGVETPLGPMDAMHIPSGVVHSGYAGPEGAVVLDVFVPVREDFRLLADAAALTGAAE